MVTLVIHSDFYSSQKFVLFFEFEALFLNQVNITHIFNSLATSDLGTFPWTLSVCHTSETFPRDVVCHRVSWRERVDRMQLSAKTDVTSHRNRGSKYRLEETYNVRCHGPPRVLVYCTRYVFAGVFTHCALVRLEAAVGTLSPPGRNANPARQFAFPSTTGPVDTRGSVSSPGPCSRKTCKKVLNSDFFWKSRTYGEKNRIYEHRVSI